ncbi:hypothetical protein [Frankia sp. Cppng1_Ct_nod]|uniref:hypothetical protein n=1 Tax=Frankia sp. Cppng1_Ct_nod TaxID=2897162 RepID=UPI0010417590|nr:hypothetical protein [Frankia sp. Cppng1_Ct_nod]
MHSLRLNLLTLYSSTIADCQAFHEGLGLVSTVERHRDGPEHVAATLAGSHNHRMRPAPGRHLLHDPDDHAVNVTVLSGTDKKEHTESA